MVRFPPVRHCDRGQDGGVVATAPIAPLSGIGLDPATCYRAVESRDRRFDGRFIVGVTTTGVYCRPSCPTPVRPRPGNVRFFPGAAAAQRAGFRSCKRCRPDATPGSPDWDVRADLAARAIRLIDDGVVDREGVEGLAGRLAVSTRHLDRLLGAELGAGPLALARARRAQTARTLIETTDLAFGDVAFAAGFGSIRQFNDTVREVFAATPRELRRRRPPRVAGPGRITVRLPLRPPFAWPELLAWFAARAVTGVSAVEGGRLVRTLGLPGGPGRVTLAPADDHVVCEAEVTTLADLPTALARCRRLLDLDADPHVVTRHLGRTPALAPLVAASPGLRVPGSAAPEETAVLAVIGQQISVAAARTIAGRLVERLGPEDVLPGPGPRRLFPSPARIADGDLDGLGMPTARARALRELAAALADGGLALDPGADRAEARARLLELAGIGPWTADYIALRALGDPDGLPATDLVLRRRADEHGLDLARSAAWSPWRAYVAQHLWNAPSGREVGRTSEVP
jgi:AraC family transcriptional regulator, regulatory protein of adaptative response / DNA-3-methyladenine glycosylase II